VHASTDKRFDLRTERCAVGVAKRARRREPDGAAGAQPAPAAALSSSLLLPEWLDAAAVLHCLADNPRPGTDLSVVTSIERTAYPRFKR
jgi:hypothetical protein